MSALLKLIRAAPVQERIADGAATASIATAGWTWLANLNAVLQVIATLIAIAAGLYAIRYHRKKLKELDRQ